MKTRRTWTDDDLILAVQKSKSIYEVLRVMGLKPDGGGNQLTIRKYIDKLGLDTNHFEIRKSSGVNAKKPLEELLVLSNDFSSIKSNSLKKRLISEGVKEAKCEQCGITQWYNHKAPLELHHINSNHFDNRLENLQILCSNCHSVTHAYKPSKKKKAQKTPRIRKKVFCKNCDEEISLYTKTGLCLSCYGLTHRKVFNRPSKEKLLQEIEMLGYLQVGKVYGVSDNAIRKWLKE